VITRQPLHGSISFAVAMVLLLCKSAAAQELAKSARPDGAQTSLRVYSPKPQGCAPLALISPGAGGTENGYSYLAEGLRDHGWLAIVIGHAESGPATLRGDVRESGLHGGLKEMVTDPVLHRDRLMDVTAALQWAGRRCPRPYKALLGHSMGSDTVMFEAGARNKLGVQGEDRFDSYIAVSPSGPGSIFPENAWGSIHKPLYVLTGTRDTGLEGPWQWRTTPFESLRPGCKWLGVIDGASHMNFAGIGFARKTERLTLDSVEAFLEGARRKQCTTPSPEPGIELKTK